MNLETKTVPKLVNPEYFTKIPEIKKPKMSFNMKVFLIFMFFSIIFLLCCKYGVIEKIEYEPIPYSY
jgi:hypothetical protein